MDNQKDSASTLPDIIFTVSLNNPELVYELPSWSSALPGFLHPDFSFETASNWNAGCLDVTFSTGHSSLYFLL